jgi:hypothetical protein
MSIEAIEAVVDLIEMDGVVGQEDIVKCLRSAIEQAEKQEPVAWEPKIETQYQDGFVVSQRIKRTPDGPWEDYTAPPQRQPLTDEQLGDLWSEAVRKAAIDGNALKHFARAIERAHGIGGGE